MHILIKWCKHVAIHLDFCQTTHLSEIAHTQKWKRVRLTANRTKKKISVFQIKTRLFWVPSRKLVKVGFRPGTQKATNVGLYYYNKCKSIYNEYVSLGNHCPALVNLDY
ncbi:hypothetical protein Hanom_Chr06g00536201 [Helianthus anomalus]